MTRTGKPELVTASSHLRLRFAAATLTKRVLYQLSHIRLSNSGADDQDKNLNW